MKSTIYEAYLKRLNDKMRKVKQNIIILVDNFIAHSKDLHNFSNIKVYFFPPNSTSVLQPMNRGIIKIFKQQYRKWHVKWMIEKLDNIEKLSNVNVLELIHFILPALKLITSSVIENGLAFFNEETTQENYESDIEDDWKTPQKIDFTEAFKEYVSTDDQVLPCEVLTVDEIYGVMENEEMSETKEDSVEIPSFLDDVKGLEIFCHFIKNVENVIKEALKNLRQLDCYQLKIAIKKQKTITNFVLQNRFH